MYTMYISVKQLDHKTLSYKKKKNTVQWVIKNFSKRQNKFYFIYNLDNFTTSKDRNPGHV